MKSFISKERLVLYLLETDKHNQVPVNPASLRWIPGASLYSYVVEEAEFLFVFSCKKA